MRCRGTPIHRLRRSGRFYRRISNEVLACTHGDDGGGVYDDARDGYAEILLFFYIGDWAQLNSRWAIGHLVSVARAEGLRRPTVPISSHGSVLTGKVVAEELG
jgi:hypothetical protein